MKMKYLKAIYIDKLLHLSEILQFVINLFIQNTCCFLHGFSDTNKKYHSCCLTIHGIYLHHSAYFFLDVTSDVYPAPRDKLPRVFPWMFFRGISFRGSSPGCSSLGCSSQGNPRDAAPAELLFATSPGPPKCIIRSPGEEKGHPRVFSGRLCVIWEILLV